MTRAAFRQRDMQRIIRAAECEGAAVQIDIRNWVVTVIPGIHKTSAIDLNPARPRILLPGNLAPDGKENWDED